MTGFVVSIELPIAVIDQKGLELNNENTVLNMSFQNLYSYFCEAALTQSVLYKALQK